MTAPPAPGREVEEPLELAADRGDVRLERLAVEQVPLRRPPRRVADHPRPAADERDRAAAVALELEQAEDRHEVADVERRRRRVEAVVAGDRPAGRQPGRQARRRRVEHARASRARRGGRPARGRPPRCGSVTASRRRAVSTHGRRAAVRSRPLCYRAATDADQPRAAPAPSTGAPAAPARTAADRPSRRIVVAIPSSSPRLRSLVGPASALLAVRRLQLLQRRACPTRRPRSTTSTSSSRRSSTTGPARSSSPASATSSASSSTFEELPGEIIDATTAIEDKDFWDNPGFDPAGIVSAGARHRQRPAARRLDDHPAARPRAAPAAEAFEGTIYERKIREIIQSIRLTQAFPGEEGKQQIITAYLNQNFYGNQSYGVKAAAKSYFGKPLKDLTLAQAAILAAIPQSPTKFDLDAQRRARSASRRSPRAPSAPKFQLVVPADSEIVQRRNYILDLMKTREPADRRRRTRPPSTRRPRTSRSMLVAAGRRPTGGRRTSSGRSATSSAEILCPDDAGRLPRRSTPAATRSRRRSTGTMQKIAEKWVYVAARAPNCEGHRGAILKHRKIPRAATELDPQPARARTSTTRAAAVMDYRTGEVLAYVGSARATRAKGNKKFQPQFDVLADGWRQPGSAIKPINYAIGIDDETMTAATMFMDVVDRLRRRLHARPRPTSSSAARSACARRSSSRSTSRPIKAGADQRPRPRLRAVQGLRARLLPSARCRSLSMGIGTLEVHPIDLLGAYGDDRQRRRPDAAARRSRRSSTRTASTVWPTPSDAARRATRVISAAGRLHHHRHPGRQHRPEGQPVLGRVGDLRRRDAPAGRLQDRHDERQPRRRRLRLPRAADGHERARRSRSASGWATATTARTTASCRSTRPRRSGRRS